MAVLESEGEGTAQPAPPRGTPLPAQHTGCSHWWAQHPNPHIHPYVHSDTQRWLTLWPSLCSIPRSSLISSKKQKKKTNRKKRKNKGKNAPWTTRGRKHLHLQRFQLKSTLAFYGRCSTVTPQRVRFAGWREAVT